MRDFAPEFKYFIKTDRRLRYLLEAIWAYRQTWATPVLTISAVVLGIAFGLLATKLSLYIGVLALGSLIVFLVAFRKPELVLLLMLTMTSTFYDIRSLGHFFGFALDAFALIFLLGLIVARVVTNKAKLVRTPLDWPIFLFVVAATISNINALYYLETVYLFRNSIWRQLMIYLIFFAVTNLVKTRRQLMTVVGGMMVMATIVAAFMVAQQAVGTTVSIIPNQVRVGVATGVGQQAISGVARISSVPGVGLVYVMLLPALILLATPEYLRGRKWLAFIPAILLPLAIAFTFTRGLWIGAIGGGIIFVFVSRFKSKRFIGLIIGLVIAAISLIHLLNVYFPRIDTVVAGLSDRFSLLLDASEDTANDSSAQARIEENKVAIPKIEEYPILGLGPGADYRPPRKINDGGTNYIHNGYFFILLNMGLVGFIPFLWFSIAHLMIGLFSWHRLQDPILKALVIGFTLSYLAVLINNTSSPRVMEPIFIIVLGLIMGINQVAIRLGTQSPPSNQTSNVTV